MFRRLRRILFHAAAAGSALLLVAVLILWPRSYFRSDTVNYSVKPRWACVLLSGEGRITWEGGATRTDSDGIDYWFNRAFEPFEDAWRSWSYGDRSEDQQAGPDFRDPSLISYHEHKFMGCEVWVSEPGFYPDLLVCIPYSYLAVLSSIMPTIWLLTRRRRRRKNRLAHGLCLKCGYDLRAHHPGDECPECGTPIPAGLVKEPIR